MRRSALVLILALAAGPAMADDFRVMKLEQDVRNLERAVGDLTRQVGDLKLQLALASGSTRPAPAPPASPGWLDAGRWERVRPGLAEDDVTALLGPPTSTRSEDGARILFYAMEISPSALLGGRVMLRDGKVTEVTRPQLR